MDLSCFYNQPITAEKNKWYRYYATYCLLVRVKNKGDPAPLYSIIRKFYKRPTYQSLIS